MKSTEEILDELNERIARLDSIFKNDAPDVRPERVRTWKESTVAYLREHVSERQAQRLENARGATTVFQRNVPPLYVRTSKLCKSLLLALVQDLKEHPAEIISLPERDPRDITIAAEGIFVAGQAFDAWRHLDAIFSSAKKAIEIVDGYIGSDVLDTLSEKPSSVVVSILTHNAPPKFLAAAKAFKAQHGQLDVRSSTAFHDRFVIVDSSQFFHFGASLKDLGKRVFMFSRIEEDLVTHVLRDAIDQEWKVAPPIVF